MLAVDQKNQAEQAKKPTLSVVDKIGTTDIPKGLIAIKILLGNARYKASFVYNKVLNHHQRAVLCYTAKLNRNALDKRFEDFNNEEKLALQKAVLQLSKVYKAFNEVNAISPKQFLQNGYEETNLQGVN
jgi:hypothetical protein